MLAARYLRSTRRDSFVSLLSILAAGGLALGVAALVLVLAGLSGLQAFLRADVLARTPHVEIELPAAADAGRLAAELAATDGVRAVRRILRGRGWVVVGATAQPVDVVAYEGRLPSFFPGASSREEGLYVGSVQAAAWGLEPGDVVEIVSPRPTLTPFGPAPRIHRLPLAGTFSSGRTEQRDERRIAVPLAVGRRLLGDAGLRLEVEGEGFEAALELAGRLRPKLPPGAELRTWQDLNRGLFFALRLEKGLMFAAIFLIVPIAALALVTVLVLLIVSKRGEIGMLRAMGATAGELERAFLALGSLLGGIGLTAGFALGIGLALACDRLELLSPPGDVYFIDHVPFAIQAQDLLLVLLATAGLTLGAAVYAARRAAALEPVEALRR